MFRPILILCVLAAAASALPSATAVNPVPERHLIGEWMNQEGNLLIEMRADRKAIFTISILRPGEKPEPQFGSYSLKDGVWTLKITDAKQREVVYSLVSLDLNRLMLRGAGTSQMTFYRIGLRFNELDKNNDGVIEHHEIKDTRLGRYFTDVDSNKDLQLTPAEYVAFWIRYPPPVVIQR